MKNHASRSQRSSPSLQLADEADVLDKFVDDHTQGDEEKGNEDEGKEIASEEQGDHSHDEGDEDETISERKSLYLGIE